MTLRDTQATFYGAISKPPGSESESRAVALLKNTGTMTPLQRLDIYRNTGLASKIKALKQIYPACESILGERLFRNLTRNYVNENASLCNDLNTYGDQFSVFIESAVNEHDELSEFIYLNDLCRLEWLWHKAYYQKNDSTFDFESFALYSQKPDEISLELSYSLEVMVSSYPIHDICRQHHDKQLESSIEGLNEVEHLCIYRQNFTPKIEKISESYFSLLSACQQRRTLEDLASDDNLSASLEALPEMISKGWICGFTHHEK